MLLGFFVVVDAYEEDVACVFRYLDWIFLALDLLNGGVGSVINL